MRVALTGPRSGGVVLPEEPVDEREHPVGELPQDAVPTASLSPRAPLTVNGRALSISTRRRRMVLLSCPTGSAPSICASKGMSQASIACSAGATMCS